MQPIAMGVLVVALSVAWSDLQAAGDARRGRELSIRYCSRCHVVGDYNRTGGIGSTPSFQWMKMLPDYAERLRTFFTRHPHPVFTRVPGYPRWREGVPYAPVFTITSAEIEDILAFLETLELPRPQRRRHPGQAPTERVQ